MQFQVGFKTDIGRKRNQNQDCGIAVPELGLFVVSDGMGGHRGGEIASSLAVQYIHESVKAAEQNRNWDPTHVLTDAIQSANRAIFSKALQDPSLQGMGTTTTALLFKDNHLAIGHVGDSRCYYLKNNLIWQATRDHSLVQEKLRAGLITRSQLKSDRMKNVITRSVGFEEKVEVEIYQMNIQVGDCFLVCSDGLSGLMEDTDILRIVQSELFENTNPLKTVDDLVAKANANGGDDNITTIVVQVTQS